jgi:transcriptional regulator with XRE-family HTH domain
MTDDDIRLVEQLAETLSRQQIADYFGMSHNTLARICKDQPEVLDALVRGKANAINRIAKSVVLAAEGGDMKAAAFYLRTQAGWVETNRTELTGKNGDPVEIDMQWTVEVVE